MIPVLFNWWCHPGTPLPNFLGVNSARLMEPPFASISPYPLILFAVYFVDMLHVSAFCNYFLYTGHTDMRKSFDGLCGVVKNQMSLDALNGSIFIFMNKRRT